MKIALVTLFCAASALAQGQLTDPAAACGPENISFNVKLGAPNLQVEPAPGKAVVYFIHESGGSGMLAYPTTKMAVDGSWAGANHGDSYFAISVDPGEHHVCAALQSSFVDQRVELAHFHAVAGGIYFYRTRLVMSKEVELLELALIDSDQGKFLISNFQLSVSTPKK